jgi:restriction system protein
MKKRTISEAAVEALRRSGKPLSAKDIYNVIIEHDLYRFNAENPENIVRVEIRRHCEGIEFPTAKSNKFFQILRDGRYWIKDEKIPGATTSEIKSEVAARKEADHLKNIVSELNSIHTKHKEAFRKQILNNLKELSPTDFELFSKKLLEVYGFKDMVVTPPSKDGGIDGYGKLKVGIAYLEVAFQSKRWNNIPVSQKEIQSFRGCIQGKCEQGIYFTTSTYTRGAKDVSLQKGAVPIILIDGGLIVDIMIEKEFGVEIDSIKVYSIDLGKVFTDDE